MSRIRSIHPGFFTDERLVQVSMATRMLFIGLCVEADDQGIFEWKPITLKMRIFPADNLNMATMLGELEGVNAIKKYEVDGRQYGAVRNFRKFQRPKSPTSVHPITPQISNYVCLTTEKGETIERNAGQFPQNGEIIRDEVTSFPQKGEINPQREDGGWKMKEGGDRKEKVNLTVSEKENQKSEILKPPPEPDQVAQAVNAWNNLASELSLPKVQTITAKRRSQTRARLRECGGLGGWLMALEKIRGSPFLLGEVNDFKANFDFMIQQSSFTKLMEGSYDGTQANRRGKRPHSLSESFGQVDAVIDELERREAAAGLGLCEENTIGISRLRQSAA